MMENEDIYHKKDEPEKVGQIKKYGPEPCEIHDFLIIYLK